MQNKLHYAVHRHTATDLIVEWADAAKELMGLTSWESTPDGKIAKADVTVAKNYLSEEEMASLERIVTLYLDYAELQAEREIPMSMEDWAKRLDGFLEFNGNELLTGPGKISAEQSAAPNESGPSHQGMILSLKRIGDIFKMSSKGSEYLKPKDCRTSHSREQDLREIIECCKSIFNSAVGGNFFNDHNLKLEFFHLENVTIVYAQFCKKYFPAYLTKYHDDFMKDGYMNSFKAQAFINDDTYGILCSLDSDIEHNRWYEIILHEMVHIYCITHEIGEENFLEKYCVNEKTGVVDNITSTGYALWREFIAYYWGAVLDPFSEQLFFAQVREKVLDLDEEVDADSPSAKMLVSQILANVFRNPEVFHATHAAAAYELLEKNKVFSTDTRMKCYEQLLQIIFEHLKKDNYWKISFSFIEELGFACTTMIVRCKAESLLRKMINP